MSTLAERLRDLADDHAPHDLSADDLWGRGRRRQRRRTVGAVALTVLLVAGVVGAGSQLLPSSQREVGPSRGEVTLPLPDRIQAPSGWTSGTDDGPVGPLVAVLGAERQQLWGSGTTGLAGLSATGAYRFLDLPGYPDTTSAVALSADGRRLAYGYDGPVSGEPGGTGDEALAGIAVYDTVTGAVRRHDVRAPHGITVDDLAWVGDDTLLANYGLFDGPAVVDDDDSSTSSGTLAPTLVWDLGLSGEPSSVASGETVGLTEATPAGDRLVEVTGRRVHLVDDSGQVTPGPRLPVAAEESRVVVSPDGARIAWIEDLQPNVSDGRPRSVLVADLADPAGTLQRLDHVDNQVLGWRDDDHVLTAGSDGRWSSVGLDGSVTEVARTPVEQDGPGVVLADDALRGPVLDAPDPEWILDPRLPLAGVLLALLAGLALAVGRWRRARLR
ncbi:hypothetical protein [Nocardioides sp.]|uniref:hypothetical protein n=1 Tax=Nocardioides sp. TaxID=35761 RepID=UPI002720BCFC|nr:hypothetical protein [Nocardioides sp.]MDO9456520.1 hypothetical protein [Nocardioides sp.]